SNATEYCDPCDTLMATTTFPYGQRQPSSLIGYWAMPCREPLRNRTIERKPHGTRVAKNQAKGDNTMNAIQKIEREQMRIDLPKFNSGDTIKVHLRIIEGEKERIQIFQGAVIRI